MADTDLAARVAQTVAFIGEQIVKDEAMAEAAQRAAASPWLAANSLLLVRDGEGVYDVEVAAVSDYRYDEVFMHTARHDPDRALRRAKATRDLVAEILAEPHLYVEGDPWFSCRQAVSGPDDPEPGSGCVRDDAGGPCGCGRDGRVARRLDIIASEWREEP